MNDDNPDHYEDFLFYRGIDTELVEFRLHGRLLCVAVMDLVADGLSAVYTFYAPEEEARSLGTFAVLWQLEYAKQQQMDYLYLGYWIKQSPKMQYKSRFKPAEILINRQWRRLIT